MCIGLLLVTMYLWVALLSWLVEAYLDGAFVGEGDGFNLAQKRQRIWIALSWPWWWLKLALNDLRTMLLAALGR